MFYTVLAINKSSVWAYHQLHLNCWEYRFLFPGTWEMGEGMAPIFKFGGYSLFSGNVGF